MRKQHLGVQRFKIIKKKNIRTKYLAFYLVLIGVFNFLGLRLAIIQALIHSCFYFLDFLGHVIHF
jgi:energy-coupling factor transporter transmembrane protein EcfT